MSQPQPLTLSIPYGKIAALTWGDPSLPPLLALHGWLDNAASFAKLAPLLTDYYIVAVDLAGHGYSDHPPPGQYFHSSDYVGQTLAIADALGWDRFTLLGHSMGGGIACFVAGSFPERIQTLALIDALGIFSVEETKLPSLFKKAILAYESLPRKKMPLYATKEDAIEARLHATPMTHNSVETLLERSLKHTEGMYTWRNDIRLVLPSMIVLSETQISAFLSQIKAPTCLIRPEQGWPFDQTLFHARQQCVQNLHRMTIPGHHHVHLDDPEGVAKLLQPFLKENA